MSMAPALREPQRHGIFEGDKGTVVVHPGRIASLRRLAQFVLRTYGVQKRNPFHERDGEPLEEAPVVDKVVLLKDAKMVFYSDTWDGMKLEKMEL